ncbi:MAG: YraN family protein [Pseudomonadota bacterium]
MNGQVAHYGGYAAEDAVARAYERRGHEIAARRWRSEAGEIDLVARKGGEVVFVEVKRARDLARAAERLGPRQLGRISRAAELFLGTEPDGTDTPSRIDVALVDGSGRIEVIENVFAT